MSVALALSDQTFSSLSFSFSSRFLTVCRHACDAQRSHGYRPQRDDDGRGWSIQCLVLPLRFTERVLHLRAVER
jgi:hypothetical protein